MDSELREATIRGKHDIVFFAEYFLGITLHPGQVRYLTEADGMVNILVPGNRFGKTVILMVRHIWHCYYKRGFPEGDSDMWTKTPYQTAALAPDGSILELDYSVLKQIMTSAFVISKEGEPIRTNHCRLEHFILLDKCHNNPPYLIQFRDNTKVKFFSGSDDKFTKVQGQIFGYGSYDEGGRSLHLQAELEGNLFSRFNQLSAPLDIASTPDQNSPSLRYHHEIYQKGLRGEGGFRSFSGSAYENVYLPNHYFDRTEEQLKGSPLRGQVMDGEFVFGGTTYFHADEINAAVRDSLNDGVPYQKGHKYIITVDTAFASDEQVVTTLDWTNDIVEVHLQDAAQGSSKSPQLHMDDFCRTVDHYNQDRNVNIGIETWNGESGRFWQDMPINYRLFTKCWGSFQPPGVPSNIANRMKRVKKEEILIALRKLLAARKIRIPNDHELLDQLSLYRENDKNLQNDRVMSLALACWLATDGRPKTPTLQIVKTESF